MTITLTGTARRASITDVTWVDWSLAAGATIILLMASAALIRGSAQWGQVPMPVFAHLATVALALLLTPVMLLRRRGDRLHRRLGYVWVAAMLVTALISFDIRLINHGGFSPIHFLSAFTAIQAPLLVLRARQHQLVAHRRSVRLMVLGALVIAGSFTFPFNRLLGQWLFASIG